MEFKNIIDKNGEDLGCVSGIQHQIKTDEARTIRQPSDALHQNAKVKKKRTSISYSKVKQLYLLNLN
ncbi:Hypothetical predicted protein, partial [Mytilus galloprovincialis]